VLSPERINLGFPFYHPPVIGDSDNSFHYNSGGIGLAQGVSSLRTDPGHHNLGIRIGVMSRPVVEVRRPRLEQGQFRLEFTAQTGQMYQMQYRDSLIIGDWLPLGESIQAQDEIVEISDQPDSSARFYRAVLLP
jgi:hypothetical protein